MSYNQRFLTEAKTLWWRDSFDVTHFYSQGKKGLKGEKGDKVSLSPSVMYSPLIKLKTLYVVLKLNHFYFSYA